MKIAIDGFILTQAFKHEDAWHFEAKCENCTYTYKAIKDLGFIPSIMESIDFFKDQKINQEQERIKQEQEKAEAAAIKETQLNGWSDISKHKPDYGQIVDIIFMGKRRINCEYRRSPTKQFGTFKLSEIVPINQSRLVSEEEIKYWIETPKLPTDA